MKVALTRAQKAESDLHLERWNWSEWEGGGDGSAQSAVAIARKFAKQKQATIKASSYRGNYQFSLESLPDKSLTEDMLRAHILSRSEQGSWKRKNDVMVFNALCKFAGLSVNLSALNKGYSPKPVRSSDLPSDEEIVQIWESLKGSGWEWVYWNGCHLWLTSP